MAGNPDIITSRQNRHVVQAYKLLNKKERDDRRLFRFDGVKLLEEAYRKGLDIQSIFLVASRAEEIRAALRERGAEEVLAKTDHLFYLSEEVFDKISEEKSPQGVITIAKYIDKFQKFATIYNSDDFLRMKNERLLLLESVRDPSNLGAVIRSAAAFGAQRLILSRDCADIYHPKTVRASMGTLFDTVIDRVEDLPDCIQGLKTSGRRVFAATLRQNAKVLGEFSLKSGDTAVIGNEGHGLSPEVTDACTDALIIPMSERAESLNAAVAASVLMWELFKAR